uniref:hypothetical protein n=1 Tax=Pseudomonas sp. TaxID=306 RepID=UPI0025876967
MSTILTEWAAAYGIPQAALHDLIGRLTVADHLPSEAGRSEAAVQADIRLAAAKRGDLVLWRNNSGALTDDSAKPPPSPGTTKAGYLYINSTRGGVAGDSELVGAHRESVIIEPTR